MTVRHHHIVAGAVAALVIVTGCGGSSTRTTSGGGGTSQALTSAAPVFAIGSPVASKSSSSTTNQLRRALSSTASIASPPGTAPNLSDHIAAIRARLQRTTVAECLANIPSPLSNGHVECFGSSLAFINHPNATTGYMSGSSGCLVTDPDHTGGNGCLPSGDLGVWTETEGGGGEACTAATMNAKVLSVSSLVNSSLNLMAGMICAANVEQVATPTSSAPLDMASILSANVQGTQFSVAKLEKLADQSDGKPTWRITITGSMTSPNPGGGTMPISVQVTHSPGDTGASGQIHGCLEMTDPVMHQDYRDGFSVEYQVASGEVTYELRSGQTPISVDASTLFDADGVYSFSEFAQAAEGVPGSPPINRSAQP